MPRGSFLRWLLPTSLLAAAVLLPAGWLLCGRLRIRKLRVVLRAGLLALMLVPTSYSIPNSEGGSTAPVWLAMLGGVLERNASGFVRGLLPFLAAWLVLAPAGVALLKRRDRLAGRVDLRRVAFSANRGTSCEDLITIEGVRTDLEGRNAERLWLYRNFPGYRKLRATRGRCPNRVVDVVEIETDDGQRREVMFDVTATYFKV
jgi:hypothetical protein